MKRIIAILLVCILALALFTACGSKSEEAAPAAEAAPEAAPAAATEAAPAEAPAAPVPGEASGEPSGDPSGEGSAAPTPEFYEPTDAYAKDFEGYRQYVTDAFATDPGAPEDLKEAYNAEFKTMTDDQNTTVQALIGLGLICSYEDFLNY